MSSTTSFPGPIIVPGSISGSELTTSTRVNRVSLYEELQKAYLLPLADARIHDAFQTIIGTPGSDDLGITTPAFGTGCPYISTGDVKNTSGTRYCRWQYELPPEFLAGSLGGVAQLQVAAGMVTTVSSGACDVDFQAYINGRTTLVSGSDLVTTSAQSIKNLVFANKVFDLTSTNLSPGTILDIRASITWVDVATGTDVIGAIAAPELLLSIKG